MESTINFGLEKCIYKKYLKIGMFSHSPPLRRLEIGTFFLAQFVSTNRRRERLKQVD